MKLIFSDPEVENLQALIAQLAGVGRSISDVVISVRISGTLIDYGPVKSWQLVEGGVAVEYTHRAIPNPDPEARPLPEKI